jgi:hypothetical protein
MKTDDGYLFYNSVGEILILCCKTYDVDTIRVQMFNNISSDTLCDVSNKLKELYPALNLKLSTFDVDEITYITD